MAITHGDREEAKSRRYADATLDELTKPADIRAYCMDAFTKAGYEIKTKKKRTVFFAQASRVATTLPGCLWLPHTFKSLTDQQQAGLLAHERIHLAQQLHVGAGKFRRQYVLSPTQRLIWELQAYTESIVAAKRMGVDTQGYPATIAQGIWDDYKPWIPLGKNAVIATSLDVLSYA
jgi:hypothetical protein